MQSFVLAVLLLVGLAHLASAACDEPERHEPHNRAHGKREHGGVPIRTQNPDALVTHLLGEAHKIENALRGNGNSRSHIQIIPDSFQIPVQIVRDQSAPTASTVAIRPPGAGGTPQVAATQATLCPNDTSQRYDRETGRCYFPGATENPCNELMDFLADADNDIYGHCACKSSEGCDYRPIGFWPQNKRCYHLYEQGPCGASEWLVKGSNGVEHCVTRACPANPTDPNDIMKTWITVNETCHQLGTQAYCGNQNEGLYFSADPTGKVVLLCSVQPIVRPCVRALVASATINCDPGQKKSSSGGCSSLVGI